MMLNEASGREPRRDDVTLFSFEYLIRPKISPPCAWSDLQSDLFEYQDFQSEKTSGMLFLYCISNANTQCIVIANPDEPLGGARELIAVSRPKVFHPREVFPQIILPSDTFSLILQPSLQ